MPKSLIRCLPLLLLVGVAEAREPHRPPERGTFFIPLERLGLGAREDAEETFALAGPAEAALAETDDAEALAGALRALVALDATRVRAAPDMAATVGAHLPRYRLSEAAMLHDAPDGEAITQLEDGSLLILLSVRSGWREVYEPAAHRIGWLAREPAAAALPAR
ncbi:hypothetical protein [Algiphilus aromaticivorans]|uniref:hypothetical protein n=1 Tax=Algiphilus aromaticivorans TaxID=382454 RepID=UPI0005C20FA3|nr:hypothetical protein [Algiphilus aromaticivorans]